MEQALIIKLRLHEGRYHGTGDWPPAPARLLQALLAGSARGDHVPQTTLDVLSWLEELTPPVIAAPQITYGQKYKNFVPNNDLDSKLTSKKYDIEEAVASIRAGKVFQPILFDAEKPIIYFWKLNGEDTQKSQQKSQIETLLKTAENLYQLGRGQDMAWAQAMVSNTDDAEQQLQNYSGVIYRPSSGARGEKNLLCPGHETTLSLIQRFKENRNRFKTEQSGKKTSSVFVQPRKPLVRQIAYDAAPACHVFELRKTEIDLDFKPWPLNEAAKLVTYARDQAAKELLEKMPTDISADIDRYLIGRNATEEDKEMRIKIIPIASIGHKHADMMIRRLAIYVPQSCPLKAGDIAWAFAQVSSPNFSLEHADDVTMATRYEHKSRFWQSVTPLALPIARRRINPRDQLKEAKDGSERLAEESQAIHAVRQALRHAGVDTQAVNVRVQREPFDAHGERAESFAEDTRFSKHALWHAAIEFTKEVSGPLLIGNGRYLGLGLMQPSIPASALRGVMAFTIQSGLDADAAYPSIVSEAARRAVIACVGKKYPQKKQKSVPKFSQAINSYVSGHEANGDPTQNGKHSHIAVVADLPRQRLLYIAPNHLQRNGITWSKVRKLHMETEEALQQMDILRAGQAGRLNLAPAIIDPQIDPLFKSATVWESVTNYKVTRHHRRLTDEEALKKDVLAEIQRIGWPAPKTINVLRAKRGPKGGLSGRLQLVFATAQKGPLLLGRTLHKGGGLFQASS